MNLLSKTRTTISTHALFERGDTVVVGVSGGPDSLALLHALRMLAPELGIALHVAHLNHQLRGADAEADAEFVAWLAREWNLPVTVEARDVAALAREKRLSLEEAGRNARQEFFARVAGEQHARVVAVGHHADDQVETVLMHFIRGAGLAGLRGMPYRSAIQDFILVRPFLDITRAEIETYCAENHLHPRRDVSNEDLTFYRNRLRHEVIPYLETLNPNLRAVVHRAAQTIADDYAYLHAQVESAYARVAREADGVIVFAREAYRALEPSLQRAILRVAILRLRAGLRNIAWQHIEDARRVALDKDAGAEATLPQGLQLVVGYGDFMIGESYPAPDIPLIHAPLVLRVPGVTELDAEWEVVVEVSRGAGEQKGGGEPWSAVLEADKIRGEICLRGRARGDRFQPSGLEGHTQSLHEFMINAKIPRHTRDLIPILCDAEKILWVCGWRVDARVLVTEATRRVLKVSFVRRVANGE